MSIGPDRAMRRKVPPLASTLGITSVSANGEPIRINVVQFHTQYRAKYRSSVIDHDWTGLSVTLLRYRQRLTPPGNLDLEGG